MKLTLGLIILSICIALAGCGNKGPLRLPDDNQVKQDQKR